MSSALPSAAVMPSAAMPLRWSSQESAASVPGDPFQPRAAASVLAIHASLFSSFLGSIS